MNPGIYDHLLSVFDTKMAALTPDNNYVETK